MNIALWVLWGAVGWCGTPWRRWPPPPDPDPWWWRVIGIVGGLAGGWLFSSAWQAGSDPATYAALSSLGALAGSIIVQDVVRLGMGGGKR
jgi:hypothetical protein